MEGAVDSYWVRSTAKFTAKEDKGLKRRKTDLENANRRLHTVEKEKERVKKVTEAKKELNEAKSILAQT